MNGLSLGGQYLVAGPQRTAAAGFRGPAAGPGSDPQIAFCAGRVAIRDAGLAPGKRPEAGVVSQGRGHLVPASWSRDTGLRRPRAGGSLPRLDAAGRDDGGRGATAGEAPRRHPGAPGLACRFGAASASGGRPAGRARRRSCGHSGSDAPGRVAAARPGGVGQLGSPDRRLPLREVRSARRTSPTISGGRSSGRSVETGSMRSWSRNWTATDAQSPARKNDSRWTCCVSASDLCPTSNWHNLQGRRSASSRTAGGGCPNWIKTVRRPCPACLWPAKAASIAGAARPCWKGRLAALGAACRLGRVTQAELAREQAGRGWQA